MTAFRDLPIRRKLLLMTLAPSAAALLLASAGFLTWDINQLRAEIREDVTAQARIVSEASAPAIEFDDRPAAGETLRALALRPHVALACLYNAERELFEQYRRDADASCPVNAPVTAAFGWSRFDVLWPVMVENKRAGTLYILRDLQDIANRLRIGAATLLGVLLLSIAVAVAVARGMQRAVAAPLLDLADIARRVSSTRDFSIRAIPLSRDETGVVVRAFNDMLDRIGEQTAELEREVDERRRVERERTEALERERDANRLKDEFLATLSHELRTPLNAVLGWTRVLRSARVEAATEERALESIERNARAQARLIEDILEVSRIVTGKLRLQVRDVDLAAIVDAAVEIVQPAAAAKRLQLRVDIEVRPALTSGDPDRLQQVIWNLLANAVKFTPSGAITVRLVRDRGYRLTVEDTGPGIDPRFLPHVFEPFRQADGTASREHGGLGLGLAIARQIVELHGGTIEARSVPGRSGATFEVCLPSVVIPASDPDGSRPGAPAHPSGGTVDPLLLRDVRVLVVDDEEDARLLMQTALVQYGADVTTASSAAEALALVERARPHVIVSDIGMPRDDGYSLIHQLRSRPASLGGAVPAVAVTAYASARDRAATESAGYQAHIAKPFEPSEVAQLVARLSHAPTRPS
jgi:signal transduction histidine kinase/ActR/RegA family two-component response regulator